MPPELTASNRDPRFAPQLRYDLRFRQGRDPSRVDVHDLSSGAAHQLYPLEVLIAQQMDGLKTVEQLVDLAHAHDPRISPAAIDRLIQKLAALGMLSNVTPDGQPIPDEFSDFTSVEEADPVTSDLDDETEGGRRSNVVDFPNPRVVAHEPTRVDAFFPTDDLEEERSGEPTHMTPDRDSPWSAAAPPPLRISLDPLAPLTNAPDDHTAPPRLIPSTSSARLGPVVDPSEQTEEEDPPPARQSLVPAALARQEEDADIEGSVAISPVEPPHETRQGWWTRPAVRRARAPVLALAGLVSLALIPYPRYVTEECAVLPMTDVEVRAQVEGIIAEILVDEGQRITADQVIARLDDRDIAVALQQAEADVQRLSANFEKMQRGSRPEEIRRAQNAVSAAARDVQFAEIEFNRKSRLFTQGVGSGEQRDNAARDLELKRAALGEARAELDLMRAGFRKEEVAVAEAELRKAQAQYEGLKKKRSKFTITSPIAGVVVTPKFRDKLHSRVSLGETIATIADTSNVKIEIYVPEREIDLVQLGQPAVVKVQSLPLDPFEGTVSFVAPVVEMRNGTRVVRTTTLVDNADGVLQGGMTGYGEINTGRSTLLRLALRRVVRWVRVRFLI